MMRDGPNLPLSTDSAKAAGLFDAHETATRAVPPEKRAGYAAAARWLAGDAVAGSHHS